ncbi:ABC transporter ATP-binding protein [Cellulomonas fimi]|uniref:ABC-type quaternary amine transporter n=1 Tax=Cellulomonas fimi TaxID=1708 RepID=A0A7Y0QHD6_CELFI|nr:ABC transporter ATP-binding protein [Cellulomonas fimi]NMR20073.1 ABC transporter ATP-binding protein [Cellulomonas fimi]
MRDGLEVRDVVVRYGETTAVGGVRLDVAPGEVLALLGPSGCGKSSLLRAVAGLEPLAAGSVRWAGADLAGVPVHRRRFGLLFQDGQLFPHRDVAGNVAFGLQMAGTPRPERARRVEELLDVVGLRGYGRRAVGTLSGGEQQRVALARALAPRPQLLLLDEPLSALDRSLRERLAADLRAALVTTGTAALFVTHDHDEAFAVADRVGVMDAGRLLQLAPPAELWRAPASRRVAEFLGYETFVPLPTPAASAPDPDPHPHPHPHPLTSALRGALGPRSADVAGEGLVAALAEGALVVGGGAGVRDTGGGGDSGGVRGRVVAVAFGRGRAVLTVDVDGLGPATAVAPGVDAWRPGDVVGLEVDRHHVAVLRETSRVASLDGEP